MRRTSLRAVALAAFVFSMSLAGIVVAQDEEKARPCVAPEHRQFDFWVGDWRVTDENGELQGTNRVEKILDGCAIQESWIGAQGMRGHSYNIYAKGRRIWHQTWVDSNGMLLQLDGGIDKRGRMVLAGETPAREGQGTVKHEISWEKLDEGIVRQTWRMSRDGGSTWNEAFVGIYTPRE
jgi:hypothetical protein